MVCSLVNQPHEHGSTIRQTAIFDPLGLAGLLYWYGIYPLHQFVFAGMLRNVARASEGSDRDLTPPDDVEAKATGPEKHALGAPL